MKKIILILLLFTGLSYSQTNLSATAPASSFGGIVHFGNNTGVDTAFLPLYDGLGNLLPIQISTTKFDITGILKASSLDFSGVPIDSTIVSTGYLYQYYDTTYHKYVLAIKHS